MFERESAPQYLEQNNLTCSTTPCLSMYDCEDLSKVVKGSRFPSDSILL
jgi:hypothetical protein